jgi:hypothetical protein
MRMEPSRGFPTWMPEPPFFGRVSPASSAFRQAKSREAQGLPPAIEDLAALAAIALLLGDAPSTADWQAV